MRKSDSVIFKHWAFAGSDWNGEMRIVIQSFCSSMDLDQWSLRTHVSFVKIQSRQLPITIMLNKMGLPDQSVGKCC